MIAIIVILCLILVVQILKIVEKRSIIDKNIIEYYLEYIFTIMLAVVLLYQKRINIKVFYIVLMISLIYEIISCIYIFFIYFKNKKSY